MNNSTTRTPWHLWLVGVIAVLFNAIGVFDFVMAMAQGADYMAKAGMTPEQIAHYLQMPGWMTAVWAIGVWGALLGSVLILLRNRLAAPIFAVSLAAFALSLLYTYVLTDGGRIVLTTVYDPSDGTRRGRQLLATAMAGRPRARPGTQRGNCSPRLAARILLARR